MFKILLLLSGLKSQGKSEQGTQAENIIFAHSQCDERNLNKIEKTFIGTLQGKRECIKDSEHIFFEILD